MFLFSFLCFAFFVFRGEELFLLFFIFNKLSFGGIHALGELYQTASLTSGQGRWAKKEKYTDI